MAKLKRCKLDCRQPSDVELAWITGIWEGEGSWGYRKGRKDRKHLNGKIYDEKPHLRMTLQMNDKDIMERVARIMDGRKITLCTGGKVHKERGIKPGYILNLSGVSAVRWTELMMPHLGKRRLEKYEHIMEKINGQT